MRKNLLVIIVACCFSILNNVSLKAQGWERTYGSDSYHDQCRTVKQLSDGGFIIAGWTDGTDHAFNFVGDYIIRTDNMGHVVWEYSTEETFYTQTHDILPLDNGSFIISSSADGAPRILKLSSSGVLEWEKSFGGNMDYGQSITHSNDGGYVFTGKISKGSSNVDAYLFKIDQNGDSVWYKEYGGNDVESGLAVLMVANGYVIAGEYKSGNSSKALLTKTDFNGDQVWSKQYGTYATAAEGICELSNGNLVLYGNELDTTMNLLMVKTDPAGNEIISKTFKNGAINKGHALDVGASDEIYVAVENIAGGSGVEIGVLKLDTDFNTIWNKNYGGDGAEIAYDITATFGGGFAATGYTNSFGYLSKQSYLINGDQDGNTFVHYISGTVFKDIDTDCSKDANEPGLYKHGSLYWMVKITPGPFGADAYYTTTDENGNYEIACESGTYTVSALPVSDQWASTCPNRNVTLANAFDVSENNDFGFSTTQTCAALVVDISSTRLRECREAVYYVNYCNNGTVDASGTQIDVRLPDEITYSSSSVTSSSQDGNQYTFDIGSLASGDCGSFVIYGDVSCDVVLGQALCAEAEIGPDPQCNASPALWDKSSVSVDGVCNGDNAVCFTITNNGSGDMQIPRIWRLYSNDELVQTGAYSLLSGNSTELCFAPNGTTLRLEADQDEEHPGHSLPRASVELCGDQNTAVGYILQVPQDDVDDFKEISCTEITASFDPNDKSVVPKGISSYNYISKEDPLEYTIRFQNTGNDTAFKVVIIDSLNYGVYDISSFRMLSSSHGFTMQVTSTGVATWTFDDIYLPDSTTDEPGSHGYVKFKLGQLPGNAKGTVIKNKANIYFDYNTPIITNKTHNTVNDTVFEGEAVEQLGLNKSITGQGDGIVSVTPNPFSSRTTFNLLQKDLLNQNNAIGVEVFNTTGALVRNGQFTKGRFEMDRSDLKSGLYFYHIKLNNQILESGKLVIHE